MATPPLDGPRSPASDLRRLGWSHVREVFEAALAQPADRRRSFVLESCVNEPAVVDQVMALLSSHEHAAGFLEIPAVDLLAPDPPTLDVDDGPEPNIGRVLGAYRIESRIGRGGMGTVYLARRVDRAFERRVAIKMSRRGLDSEAVIRRFEHERQILASLEHPNIARLLDGGTTDDGVPYLVMELVEGSPIDVYCDSRRLSITDRLFLFRRVCETVQYAHQRLVIHRDLKPNNILVEKDGAPKLLDFGIAKLLDPAQSIETTLVPPLTPAYASPEQIRGERISTASDVYSLGVLLYQLLTGRSPYFADTGSSLQLARAVCDTEPVRPSSVVTKPEAIREADASARRPEELSAAREGSPLKLRKRLAGDLDDIVLKALRKEPEQRYQSAEQLSEDIRRHLEGLPITASKGSFRYRAGKFVIRHKIAIAAAAVVVLAILSGTAATAWQARIARQQAEIAQLERTRAERRFNDVRKLANSMIFELHDSIEHLPGATAPRKLIVERALEYLDSLAAEVAADQALQAELAYAYRRVADVQGNPHEANLGDAAGALASYNKAKGLLEPLVAAGPTDAARRLDLARTLLGIGAIQVMMRDAPGAVSSYRRALGIAEKLVEEARDKDEARRALAAGHYRLAEALAHVQSRKEAADHLERAIAIYGDLAGDTGDKESQLALVRAFKALGILRAVAGDFQANLGLMQKAYALSRMLTVAQPLNSAYRNEVAMSSMELGHAYVRAEKLVAALRSFREAEAITASMASADPNNAQARWMQGIELNNVGDVLRRLRRHREALAAHAKALALSEALAQADPANESYAFMIADTCQFMGETYLAMAGTARSVPDRRDAWSNARSWYRRSAAVFEAMRERRTLTAGVTEEADPRSLASRVSQRLLLCDRQLRQLPPRE